MSTARYRIHPAIGIARVGNAAPSEYFLGPERPNQRIKRSPDVGTAVPPFKTDGLVKRQAARFRVWEYLEDGGVFSPSREVSLEDQDVAELTWTVHLANRKASFFKFDGLSGSPQRGPNPHRRNDVDGRDVRTLEIDPLARAISGRSAEPVELSQGTSSTPSDERWPDPQPERPITSLGQLRTDDAGRLIVIPGAGIASGRPGAEMSDEYANNDDWFDDVGDGPITVTLKLRTPDGVVAEHQVEGAWLIVGPPDFAPPLPQVVSLYDVLFDLAVQHLPIPEDESTYQTGELARLSGLRSILRGDATTYRVDFDTDVAPILRAALAVTSVYEPSHRGTFMDGASLDETRWAQLSDPTQPNAVRQRRVFGRVRMPGAAAAELNSDRQMPRLLGDDPSMALSVTKTQYAILERWQAGDFVGSRFGPSSLMDPPESESMTPHGLDRAATECASGGGFCPGIEVGWQIREPSLFAEPFRIKRGAPSKYLGEGEGSTTVDAGHFSRQMALPWMKDFLLCKGQSSDPVKHPDDMWGWWPSQRPDWVVTDRVRSGDTVEPLPWHRASGPDGQQTKWPPENGSPGGFTPTYRQMIDNWSKFGFVLADDEGRYRETERADHVPGGDGVS